MQANQVLGDVLHRFGGVAQRGQVALHGVEPLQHIAPRFCAADQLAFEGLKALLHAFDHRPEAVDDEVEHQIQRIGRGRLDAIGGALQALAHLLVAGAAVVTDGDDVIAADKHVRFAHLHARIA